MSFLPLTPLEIAFLAKLAAEPADEFPLFQGEMKRGYSIARKFLDMRKKVKASPELSTHYAEVLNWTPVIYSGGTVYPLGSIYKRHAKLHCEVRLKRKYTASFDAVLTAALRGRISNGN